MDYSQKNQMRKQKMKKSRLNELQKLIESNPKNDSKTNYEVCKGLSEVCVMLSQSKESTKEQKKQFLKYADIFDKFAKIHNKSEEVKMEKAKIEKTKADILREEKRIRELEKQKRERVVHEIMDKISALGKSYEERVFEVAVGRWKNQKTERRSAEREIAEAQRKLEEVKRRYAK